MLSVYFENVITRQQKQLGPLPLLRVAGTSLVDQAGGILAAYHGGLWRVGEEHFFVIGIQSPVVIHFEGDHQRSSQFGPYNPAWLIDGAVRAGLAQQHALARLDETSGTWHVYADRTSWSGVVFTPSET
ncbi:MAG TPA: hypothetical protein VFW87_05590 [Pirellulales bacterium]|nr:hypothetical protein [Pirellulales bacterium]